MEHCYPESGALQTRGSVNSLEGCSMRQEGVLCKAKTGGRAGEPEGDLAQELGAIQYLQWGRMTMKAKIPDIGAVGDDLCNKLARQQLLGELKWVSPFSSEWQSRDAALWSGKLELQWKDAVRSAETLPVGPSFEILPATDECRERWGKHVQQSPSGSDKLMEEIRIRSDAKNDREDFVWNEGFGDGQIPVEMFSLPLQSYFSGLN